MDVDLGEDLEGVVKGTGLGKNAPRAMDMGNLERLASQAKGAGAGAGDMMNLMSGCDKAAWRKAVQHLRATSACALRPKSDPHRAVVGVFAVRWRCRFTSARPRVESAWF